jgi:hypothetical protein
MRKKWLLATIVLVGFAQQASAQTPCRELIELRNAANAAWKQAMKAPASELCFALGQASTATHATLRFAENNRETCAISNSLLSQVERYDRDASTARDNVCAGRPLRPYPPDIIRH